MPWVCWRCRRPGADLENRRGEPVHRDCLAAYLRRPRVEIDD